MKKLIYITFLLASQLYAQQLPQYTQFIFNKIGYNPASAGTSLLSPTEIIFGARTQWMGLSNNPKSVFLSAHYTFVPQRAYRNWHCVGVYFDQDRNGVFVDNSMYACYSFHQLLTQRWVMSVGVFVGAKQFYVNTSLLDRNDPAVAGSARSFFTLPDVVPGIRIDNKKFFAGLSFWQVSVFQQKSYLSSKQIGSPSQLPFHYIFCIGQKFQLPLDNKLQVALNLRGNYKAIPSFELNVMNYWYKRFAYGFSVRDRNFLSGIFQIRIVNNLIMGFSYDLSVSRFYRAAPNTVEVMVGVSPAFGTTGERKLKSSVDDCSF
jgi:type IX secretion system PorP/SprF family membrane protein